MDTSKIVIWGCVLAVLLICYIIALIKSKRGEIVLTTNGWDMALLLTCPILTVIGSLAGEQPPYSTFQYIVWGIAIVCLIGTIIFSIVSNAGSIGNILISIGAKLFIIWLTMFIFLVLIAIFVVYLIISLSRSRSDEEYILLKYDKFLKAYVGYKI